MPRVTPGVDASGAGWGAVKDSGWYWAHEAIRADLADTLAVLDRLAGAAAPAPWERDALLLVWGYVAGFIRHHHHNEEAFFFPKMRERVALPPSLESDHATLVAMLDATDALLGAEHAKAAGADWREVARSLRALEAVMLPHLREEEEQTLPLMHARFSAADFAPIERQVVGQMPWHSMGHMYRRLGDDDGAKRAHACGALGVPRIVWSRVLRPRVERYQAEVGWLFEALLLPQSRAFWAEQAAMHRARRGACGCLRPRPAGRAKAA